MAPEGSGISVFHRSEIADTVKITLVKPFIEESNFPAEYWWAEVAATAIHELLHLNYDIVPGDHSRVNEEAAASLLETCLKSDIAAETQGGLGFRSDILASKNQRFFPGIEDGAFFPAADELATLPHASIRGDNIASAILYLEMGREQFLYRDTSELKLLKQACLRFGREIPNFSEGARPWRE